MNVKMCLLALSVVDGSKAFQILLLKKKAREHSSLLLQENSFQLPKSQNWNFSQFLGNQFWNRKFWHKILQKALTTLNQQSYTTLID